MLEVSSISRSFGDFKAVDDVSFAVNRGEVVGLLGHNGAGKTTIMKMLSGYLESDSGTITFNGEPVDVNREHLQRELGYLPENLPVYPELSVASYLDYAARLKGLKSTGKRTAIRLAVEATDLGDRLLSPIATLSRGLKQRVGVAQAILGSPSLLILDEPTNGLDPSQTEQMRQLIKRISENATVILSTHIMQEVEAVCHRALIVRSGQLVVDASLTELKQANKIILASTADADAIKLALNDITEIVSIDVRGDAESAGDEYLLTLENDTDIPSTTNRVVRTLVGKEIPVMGIAPDSRDLQSLFLDMGVPQSHPSLTDITIAKKTKPEDQAGAEQEVTHVA